LKKVNTKALFIQSLLKTDQSVTGWRTLIKRKWTNGLEKRWRWIKGELLRVIN